MPFGASPAQIIKADLDKLSWTPAGFNRHENRMFWLDQFVCLGEEGGLKKLEMFMGLAGGELPSDPRAKMTE